MLITCPSGLSFKARRWILNDHKILRDPKLLNSGRFLIEMISTVDQGVVECGPYNSFAVGKPAQWGKVVLGDILYALLQVRVATLAELDFGLSCGQCNAKVDLTVDLAQIKTTPMHEKAKQHLETGIPIKCQVTLHDGMTLVMELRMLLGEDLPKWMLMQKHDKLLKDDAQRLLQVHSITPAGKEPITQFDQIKEFYYQQDWSFQTELDSLIDLFGGGVDTTVDFTCDSCGTEGKTALPFSEEFFNPRRKTKGPSSSVLL